ncbi:hypothetical protein E3N88_44605 [Mikania micrantha]|uniref:TF-B3 domain-containing protein n=1 Tax=Mikania micrantha TaxID=192012 RepID=A0A5N6LBI9_9ASTR|nr:hypothetical protein E3N88_44605 [Mikania micrantha]
MIMYAIVNGSTSMNRVGGHAHIVISLFIVDVLFQNIFMNALIQEGYHSINEIPNSFSWCAGNWLSSVVTNRMNKTTPLTEELEKYQFTFSNSSKEFGTHCTSGIDNGSSLKSPLLLPTIFSNQLPLSAEPNNNKPIFGSNLVYEPCAQQSNGVVEGKVPSFKKEQKSHQIVPKQLKLGVSMMSKSNKGMALGSNNQVDRSPSEGRGRSQLLPRYWPQTTDQELLQIHGDLNSNCTITPLFEKTLSASDAGRIGRLVLPKACAEMYFPPIDQSEGVPVKIRDVKGKDWTFQFRFWPNNNSRMYVLEGVTPCILNMQLQAGDTVIFSRIDPDDKLVIGYRKATVSVEASALANPVNGGALIHTDNGSLPTNMEHEGTSIRDLLQEKKKTRNIRLKSKRLHMRCEDALELKLTWKQAQEYLRPPLSKPTDVMIENCEFEEYDEPPVFGKKTIFTTNVAQLQDQWVQCDSCFKWRRLPLDVLVLSKWTCSDNVLDEKSPTTRHPRHRPGCSCIVCIQPPSGKGKHKQNCICNVCSTVRRRFKTLMLRKKKRLAEQEGETFQNSDPVINRTVFSDRPGPGTEMKIESSNNKAQELDLNCDPIEEQMMLAEAFDTFRVPQELDLNCTWQAELYR